MRIPVHSINNYFISQITDPTFAGFINFDKSQPTQYWYGSTAHTFNEMIFICITLFTIKQASLYQFKCYFYLFRKDFITYT